eukprot:8541818-Pyramimonas_sp.AAC.1
MTKSSTSACDTITRNSRFRRRGAPGGQPHCLVSNLVASTWQRPTGAGGEPSTWSPPGTS